MAGERNNTPWTAEIIFSESGDIIKNSTRKIGIPSSGAKVLSRYLRPSTGSCHDFCKYGAIHAHETKARSPVSKMIKAKRGESQKLENTVSLTHREKKLASAVSVKPSPGSKSQKPDNHIVIKREVPLPIKKEIVSSKKLPSPFKELDVSAKRANGPKLKPTQPSLPSLQTGGYLSRTRSHGMRKCKEMGSLSMNSPGALNSRRNSEIKSSKEMRTSIRREKNVLKPPCIPLSPKRSIKRVSRMNAENSNNLKGTSYMKNLSNVGKTKPEKPTVEDVPEKTLYVIETNSEAKSVRPTKNGVYAHNLPPSSSSFSENKTLKRAQNQIRSTQSPPSPEKNLGRTKNGSCATGSLPSFSRSPDNKGLRPTRYGSRIVQSPLTSLSLFSSLSSSKSPHSGSSEHDETENENQIMNSKAEYKSRPRRGEISSSKYKDCPAQKLNFKRGKVVDLEPEVSTPRRLKFRRRVLLDNRNGNADVRRKIFGKKETNDAKVNATKIESKEIILRHQDVVGKKDAQSLLNNVIKETASKLVETRKSKVKALVGAFETVISLQDTKTMVTASVY